MTQAPCKDCSERNAECHAKCEKYLAWNEQHIAERTALYKAKQKDRLEMAIIHDRINRQKKHFNHSYKEK